MMLNCRAIELVCPSITGSDGPTFKPALLTGNPLRDIGMGRRFLRLVPIYFSRSHTSLRKSVLPGFVMLGAGAESMNS